MVRVVLNLQPKFELRHFPVSLNPDGMAFFKGKKVVTNQLLQLPCDTLV